MVLARYQSSKLQGLANCWFGALSIYLGQASGDFQICRQNLGRSGNCEIPNGLGFCRHMKTKLKDSIALHRRRV